MVAFRRAFEEFKELAREQQDVLKDGALSKIVVQAMGRMPTATALFIWDTNTHVQGSLQRERGLGFLAPSPHPAMEMASKPYLFLENLIRTKTWAALTESEQGESLDAQDLPIGLLHDLPLGIARTGTTLTHFDLRVTVPSIVDFEVSLSQRDLSILHSIGRSLRMLHYTGAGLPEHTGLDLKNVSEYFGALASGRNLQGISIEVDRWSDLWMPLNIFLTPTPKPWNNLVLFALQRGAFHLHELKTFFGQY